MPVLDFPAWLHSPANIAVAVASAFVIGSMVGSFLNVVAHRVPRGETVVHGRSHCPACGRTIRARDNVPVLGWLALRGRCRDCGAAISARYPLVEGACGGLAFALALVEIAAVGGADPQAAGIAWCGRTAVAFTLVAWALLEERGHAVSGFTAGLAAAAAALAAACLPSLHPLPIGCAGEAWNGLTAWPGHLVASLIGVVAGRLAGGLTGGRLVAVAAALSGAAQGWQAALLAVLAAAVGRTIGRGTSAGGLAAAMAVLGWTPLAMAWSTICRCCTGT